MPSKPNLDVLVAQWNKTFTLGMGATASLLDYTVKMERENAELAAENEALKEAFNAQHAKLELVA